MGQLWDSDQITQLHISELDPFAVRAAGRQRLRLVVRQLSDGSFVTMPAAVLSDGRDSPRVEPAFHPFAGAPSFIGRAGGDSAGPNCARLSS